MDNFQIEDEDEIFFGLPEEEEDFSGIDYLWDQDESELEKAAAFEAPTSTSASTANRPKAKKRTAKAKKISDKPRLQCPHCTKTYATERTLKTHLNTVVLKGNFLQTLSSDITMVYQCFTCLIMYLFCL